MGGQVASAAKTPYLHYTPIAYYMNNILATRQPRAIQDYSNISRPFSGRVWALLILSVVTLSVLFWMIHSTYQSIDKRWKSYEGRRLSKTVYSKLDFFLKTFSMMTEPDRINWFPNWSTGILVNYL